MKCLVLCGGKNTRMGDSYPKVLMPIKDKPLIVWVIEFWQKHGINEFVFLTGHHAEKVEPFIKDLPIKKQIVRGDGNLSFACDVAKTEPYMGDKFIVAMADCLNMGVFDSYALENYRFGVGVIKAPKELITINYGVSILDDQVSRVTEHPPAYMVRDYTWCGMGTFLMGKEIFDAIANTSVSGRTMKVEFIDAIQTLIDRNHEVYPLYFNGTYVNMNTPNEAQEIKKVMEAI